MNPKLKGHRLRQASKDLATPDHEVDRLSYSSCAESDDDEDANQAPARDPKLTQLLADLEENKLFFANLANAKTSEFLGHAVIHMAPLAMDQRGMPTFVKMLKEAVAGIPMAGFTSVHDFMWAYVLRDFNIRDLNVIIKKAIMLAIQSAIPRIKVEPWHLALALQNLDSDPTAKRGRHTRDDDVATRMRDVISEAAVAEAKMARTLLSDRRMEAEIAMLKVIMSKYDRT